MRNLEFKEFTGKAKDADGDEHESTIRAAVIDRKTATVKDVNGNDRPREVNTPGGRRAVQPGDVVVETSSADVYDVMAADAWKGTGYSSSSRTASRDKSDSAAASNADRSTTDKDSDGDGESKSEESSQAKRTLPNANS